MTAAEIIILIVGAILFTISFFIPAGGAGTGGKVDASIAEQAVKDALKEEMKKVKSAISAVNEETLSENKDKMERFMDRLTNEKMMAVNEYSDTVLNQIHKDHDEAVFLYDMIDSKYNQVKSTAAEINQIEKSVKRMSAEAPKAAVVAEKKVEATPAKAPIPAAVKSPSPAAVKQEVQKPVAEAKFVAKPIVDKDTPVIKTEPAKSADEAKASDVIKAEDNKKTDAEASKAVAETTELDSMFAKQLEQVAGEEAAKPVKKKVVKTVKKADEPEVASEPIANSDVELMFDNGSMNNNDRILALHKEGKSNMAIAKELGLGVGEVKLVIDLFKSF
ncbi:MAG: hypothetical protein KBS96_05520 [Lachnospiraceae bacterium]|nr:hypothetical protein [Candidatus Colinaster scatohippi]